MEIFQLKKYPKINRKLFFFYRDDINGRKRLLKKNIATKNTEMVKGTKTYIFFIGQKGGLFPPSYSKLKIQLMFTNPGISGGNYFEVLLPDQLVWESLLPEHFYAVDIRQIVDVSTSLGVVIGNLAKTIFYRHTKLEITKDANKAIFQLTITGDRGKEFTTTASEEISNMPNFQKMFKV